MNEIYEVYDNLTGAGLNRCNSRFALIQCMDSWEEQGVSVSYSFATYYKESERKRIAKLPMWGES